MSEKSIWNYLFRRMSNTEKKTGFRLSVWFMIHIQVVRIELYWALMIAHLEWKRRMVINSYLYDIWIRVDREQNAAPIWNSIHTYSD